MGSCWQGSLPCFSKARSRQCRPLLAVNHRLRRHPQGKVVKSQLLQQWESCKGDYGTKMMILPKYQRSGCLWRKTALLHGCLTHKISLKSIIGRGCLMSGITWNAVKHLHSVYFTYKKSGLCSLHTCVARSPSAHASISSFDTLPHHFILGLDECWSMCTAHVGFLPVNAYLMYLNFPFIAPSSTLPTLQYKPHQAYNCLGSNQQGKNSRPCRFFQFRGDPRTDAGVFLMPSINIW